MDQKIPRIAILRFVLRLLLGATALLLFGLSIYRFVRPHGNDSRVIADLIAIAPYAVLFAVVVVVADLCTRQKADR